MKHLVMSRPKDPPPPPPPPLVTRAAESGTSAAFDIWLQRSLHQLFDTVAKEPIPEELLRLIEADRRK
jgi:hypothetical protein